MKINQKNSVNQSQNKDDTKYVNKDNDFPHVTPIIPGFEQPNPAIATPHFPVEMPERTDRD